MTTLLETIEAKLQELKERAETAEHAIISEFMYVIGKNNHSANPDSEAPVAATEPEAPAVTEAPAVAEPEPTLEGTTPQPVAAPVEAAPEAPQPAVIEPAAPAA
jgi:hypothetical protein